MLHVILELASVFVKTDDLLRNVNTHATRFQSVFFTEAIPARAASFNIECLEHIFKRPFVIQPAVLEHEGYSNREDQKLSRGWGYCIYFASLLMSVTE